MISMLTNFNGDYFKNGQDHQIVINGKGTSIDRDNHRRKMFSYIFQDPHILNTFTIEENIQIVNPNFNFRTDIDHIIDELGNVSEERNKYIAKKFLLLKKKHKESPYSLSGGEKQLLSFLRAMVKSSRVIFADEPWANMDQILKDFVEEQLFLYLRGEDIFSNFRTRNLNHNMVVIITHSYHHKEKIEKSIDKKWQYKLPVQMYEFKDNKLNLLNSNIVELNRFVSKY